MLFQFLEVKVKFSGCESSSDNANIENIMKAYLLNTYIIYHNI